MNINAIWCYYKKISRLLEKPIYNKTNNIIIKSLNGYDVIRERLDEHNTLTVRHQPIESVKRKVSIGLKSINHLLVL